MSAAYIQMQARMLLPQKQTLWSLTRLLLREQSDLGPYCFQYMLPNYIIKQMREVMTSIVKGKKGLHKVLVHRAA